MLSLDKKQFLAKLPNIRTAGNVTFVNVFNHIFNKTTDVHRQNPFPPLSVCLKSVALKALLWAES